MACCLCFSCTRLCVLVCMHACVFLCVFMRAWCGEGDPNLWQNTTWYILASASFSGYKTTLKQQLNGEKNELWFRCPFQRGHFKLMTVNIGRRELLSCVPRLGLFLTVKSILLCLILSPQVEVMFSASYANGTGRTERWLSCLLTEQQTMLEHETMHRTPNDARNTKRRAEHQPTHRTPNDAQNTKRCTEHQMTQNTTRCTEHQMRYTEHYTMHRTPNEAHRTLHDEQNTKWGTQNTKRCTEHQMRHTEH